MTTILLRLEDSRRIVTIFAKGKPAPMYFQIPDS
jgi:hypothetical protein